MSHHQTMTVIGYGILVLLFSPILLGAAVILLTAIRERRHLAARRGRASPPRIQLRESVKRKPLQVVERSASGTVRVTPLPVPRLPGSAGRNGKRRSP